MPELACRPGKGEWLRGAISFSPSVDYMEHAYDDAKYGRFSRRPYIDCIIPTLVDPSMAPPGKHVMSCFVQYAPYHLSDGRTWDDAERDAFGETVISTLEERFPNIRKLILHQQVITPLDIERITGLTEGNIFQGELSLEQLFFNRPVPGWARYRTPIKTSGCAAPPPIPAAGSWAPPDGSPRSSCWALARGRAGSRDGALRRRDRRSGPQRLVTAAYLAKAGRKVLVLERRDRAGGVLDTLEIAPGFGAPGSCTPSAACEGPWSTISDWCSRAS